MHYFISNLNKITSGVIIQVANAMVGPSDETLRLYPAVQPAWEKFVADTPEDMDRYEKCLPVKIDDNLTVVLVVDRFLLHMLDGKTVRAQEKFMAGVARVLNRYPDKKVYIPDELVRGDEVALEGILRASSRTAPMFLVTSPDEIYSNPDISDLEKAVMDALQIWQKAYQQPDFGTFDAVPCIASHLIYRHDLMQGGALVRDMKPEEVVYDCLKNTLLSTIQNWSNGHSEKYSVTVTRYIAENLSIMGYSATFKGRDYATIEES